MKLFGKHSSIKQKSGSLRDFWEVKSVSEEGILTTEKRRGFMLEADGMDDSFLSSDQRQTLHDSWRSVVSLTKDEEVQIVFRKRVNFSKWVEEQLRQTFLSNNSYGRRILLERLSDQVAQFSENEPALLSQSILVCYWTNESLDHEALRERQLIIESRFSSMGFAFRSLNRERVFEEVVFSSQDTSALVDQEHEWPFIKISPENLTVNHDSFRALELVTLPESFTELGMIRAITRKALPMDISVRLRGRDQRPIISMLHKKRNLLQAKRANKASAPEIDSQLDQIDRVLRCLADSSDSVLSMQMTIGLRFPNDLNSLHRKGLATLLRSALQLNFCEFEESTIGIFDSYLECIPSFRGLNVRQHTVLASNAIHFLPFFRPSVGDRRQIASFQTPEGSVYGIDPVDPRLANYNWLICGTSGAGKSFLVNSLLVQSLPLDPDVFIVDIGGSYSKLTKFLDGKVFSLEPKQGFSISPIFLSKSPNLQEERMRRRHVLQIFLEMTRVDGALPSLEVRNLLSEILDEMLGHDTIPEHPISSIVDRLSKMPPSQETKRLEVLLRPWTFGSLYGEFLDTNILPQAPGRIITFDLKGLTVFEDLARVVQLIICAKLWAHIRQQNSSRFSWIVLDEVAFSLLKVQPEFVDELVSTLRKYFAGAMVIVQDIEKITSSPAGASILQNTQTKAILQQRGDPRNYREALNFSEIDEWAIRSLKRKKGSFSDFFLIREYEKAIVRYVPCDLEYWLATTAPEDRQLFQKSTEMTDGIFQDKVIDFIAKRKSKPC